MIPSVVMLSAVLLVGAGDAPVAGRDGPVEVLADQQLGLSPAQNVFCVLVCCPPIGAPLFFVYRTLKRGRLDFDDPMWFVRADASPAQAGRPPATRSARAHNPTPMRF